MADDAMDWWMEEFVLVGPRSGLVIAGPIASGRGMTEPNLGQIRLVSLWYSLMSLNPHNHNPRNPFILPKQHGTDYSFCPSQFFK